MSATNTTTNYNLPIFIETDKPAWLVDFNGAMRSIDAQMKTNADAIATKSPILSFTDTTTIDFTVTGNTVTADLDDGVAGTISRAFTRPVSAPVDYQIPSVDNTNAQELLSVGAGLKIDNGSLKAVDLDLTEHIKKLSTDFSEVTAGNTIGSGALNFAFNSDRSIGKIYGGVYAPATSYTGDITFYTGVTVPNPSGEEYTISPLGIVLNGANPVSDYGSSEIVISATGKVYAKTHRYASNKTVYTYFFPCILFFKNFGDTPLTP